MTILAANIAARRLHTELLCGERDLPNTSVALSAAEASEALFGIAYKQPGMPTFDDCRDAVERVRDRYGIDEAVCLLNRFGIETIKDMWLGAYERFIRFADATITHGVPPSASWDDEVPMHPEHGRWLLYHPESEALWEERGPANEEWFGDGLVVDVTGKPEFEARFKHEKEEEL